MRKLWGMVAALVAYSSISMAAPFTAGNLVVLQVGDETTGNLATDNASPIVLKEFRISDSDGTVAEYHRLPTEEALPNHICTQSSNQYQGHMSRSENGLYLVLGGYDAELGRAHPHEADAAVINRVIARIDQAGNIDTTTALNDAFSRLEDKGGIQTVASVDGSGFWCGGRGDANSNACVRYAAWGATTSVKLNASSTFKEPRVVGIYNGQLYATFNISQLRGLWSVGTGHPTTAGQSTDKVVQVATAASPIAFFFFNADTIYVCSDALIVQGGGLYKFTRDTNPQSATFGQFVLNYIMSAGLKPGSQALYSVTGTSDEQGHAVLYVITREDQNPGGPNRLMKIVDTGCHLGSEAGCSGADAFVPLQTSPAGTVFRSVAWAPLACGDGDECKGSCCHPGVVSSCTQETATHCDGNFRGIGSLCETPACPILCAHPFADADNDGDVDMQDFAEFQLCYTGVPSSTALNGYCTCFDRPTSGYPAGDGAVNEADLAIFQLCVTGADIPVDPSCAP